MITYWFLLLLHKIKIEILHSTQKIKFLMWTSCNCNSFTLSTTLNIIFFFYGRAYFLQGSFLFLINKRKMILGSFFFKIIKLFYRTARDHYSTSKNYLGHYSTGVVIFLYTGKLRHLRTYLLSECSAISMKILNNLSLQLHIDLIFLYMRWNFIRKYILPIDVKVIRFLLFWKVTKKRHST